MCWEGKSAKACGAGLLSSCEELEVSAINLEGSSSFPQKINTILPGVCE